MKIKRKTSRKDGKVFWGYKNKKGVRSEIWITLQQFEKREKTRRLYVRKNQEEFTQQQLMLPVEERWHVGKYNPENGLYFIRVGSNGKPTFGTKDKLDALRKINKISRKKYNQNCKNLPLPSVCVGDQHPSNPSLYVKRIFGNKIFYDTFDRVQDKIRRLKLSYKNYKIRHKEEIKKRNLKAKEEKKKFFRENAHLKRSRGDIDPILGLIFWGYKDNGKEIWCTPEKFQAKRLQTIQKRRRQRQLRKEVGKNGTEMQNRNC